MIATRRLFSILAIAVAILVLASAADAAKIRGFDAVQDRELILDPLEEAISEANSFCGDVAGISFIFCFIDRFFFVFFQLI